MYLIFLTVKIWKLFASSSVDELIQAVFLIPGQNRKHVCSHWDHQGTASFTENTALIYAIIPPTKPQHFLQTIVNRNQHIFSLFSRRHALEMAPVCFKITFAVRFCHLALQGPKKHLKKC